MPAIASPRRIDRYLRSPLGRVLPRQARLLVGLNAAPHPGWLDILPNATTLLSKGGAIWVLGALGATGLGLPRSARALTRLLPGLLGTVMTVQYLLKPVLNRPRPISGKLRALAQGRRSSASLPSGDAAATFAGAWLLTRTWPRLTPAFAAVAALLGYSRVRVGSHRPTEVAAGAASGIVLSELFDRATARLLGR